MSLGRSEASFYWQLRKQHDKLFQKQLQGDLDWATEQDPRGDPEIWLTADSAGATWGEGRARSS